MRISLLRSRISHFASRNKEIFSWALYDWANSAFATTVMAGFFPLFFKTYYSAGSDVTASTAQLGLANSLSSLIVALLAPALGAIADAGSLKKRFLFLFTYLGVLMTAALALVHEGEWEIAAFLYVMGSIGFAGGMIFYDALLKSVATDQKCDVVSGFGYGFGYLGGGLLFVLHILMYQKPELFGLADRIAAVKLSFFTVALWWALFSIPIFLFVKEDSQNHSRLQSPLAEGYRRFVATFKKIGSLKMIFLFLAAYWFYIDAVDTVIRMAVDYGIAIGFEAGDLIVALLAVQFIGFPSAILFGHLGQRWDTKKAIMLAIGVYLGVVTWAFFMQSKEEFFAIALLVGIVQGGIQSLSRSLYAKMIPARYAAEFFGFYNLLGKFAAILGPVMVGFVGYATESPRIGILSILLLFAIGAALLWYVDVEKGIKEGRQLQDGCNPPLP